MFDGGNTDLCLYCGCAMIKAYIPYHLRCRNGRCAGSRHHQASTTDLI